MSRISKLIIASFLIAGASALVSGGTAGAHDLKQDNGISVVLHIPPEDNPKAGQLTELELSFGDNKDAFTLQDCDCQVMVKHGSRILQTLTPEPAQTGATLDSKVYVQFPNIGVYDIVVAGKARDATFGTFSLDYSVPVATSNSGARVSSGQGSEILLISSGSLITLTVLAYGAIKQGGRYRSKSKGSQASSTASKR